MAVLSNLASALKLLAVDPRAREQFDRDPEGAADLFGMKGTAREAFISRDPSKIQAAIRVERGLDIQKAAGEIDKAGPNDTIIIIVLAE